MFMNYRGCLIWFIGFSAGVILTILYIQDVRLIHEEYSTIITDPPPSDLKYYVTKSDTVSHVLAGDGQRSNEAQVSSQGPLKVVIVTYMRSGSSFTGDLIQQHPDVFYVFEPLLTIEWMYTGRIKADHVTFLNGSTQSVPTNDQELKTQYVQILQAILDCRLRDVNLETFHQNLMQYSDSTKKLSKCVRKNLTDMETCLEPPTESCQRSKIRLIKVIRASMIEAEDLLSLDPSVRIIHLLRDARGTSRSRVYFSGPKAVNDEELPLKLCEQQVTNMELSIQLSEKFPGRILTVRYEDLVDDPVKSTKQLYKFLGLKMTPDIEAYIRNITFGGLKDNCNICTTRTNATETAYRWRQELSFKQVELIQSQCQDALNMLGHRIFQSERELRDKRLRSKLDDYNSRVMKVEPPRLIT